MRLKIIKVLDYESLTVNLQNMLLSLSNFFLIVIL